MKQLIKKYAKPKRIIINLFCYFIIGSGKKRLIKFAIKALCMSALI